MATTRTGQIPAGPANNQLTAVQSLELDDATRSEVAHEIADVLLYLVRLADVLEIDIVAAAREKIGLNAHKYPARRGL